VFLLAWLGSGAFWIHNHHTTRSAQAQVPMAETTLAFEQWQDQGWRELPTTRSVLGPVLAQSFDFQLAGALETIEQALIAQGWSVIEPMSWRRVVGGFSRNPMPFPRAFNGRSEALWLKKTRPDGSVSHVFRLWASGVSLAPKDIEEKSQPVWLGQLRATELERNWLGLARWVDVPAADEIEVLANTWPNQLIIPAQRPWLEPNG